MTKISWIQIFATVFQLITSIAGLCNETNVGIRDELKIIPNDQMTNSTNNGSDFLPEFGRLHGAKAWCPDTEDPNPYLQIDLERTYVICAVEVQGLPGASLATNFTLNSSIDGEAFTEFNSNQQFTGSAADGDVADFHELSSTIKAQFIRFRPTSASICLRVEVYGTPDGVDVTCNDNDIQVEIVPTVGDGLSEPFNDLSLRDTRCNASFSNESQINFNFTLGTCNTTVYISNDGVKSFYYNVIKNSTTDFEHFNIICSYIREPTQLGTETGSFSFAMKIFSDDNFQTRVDPGDIISLSQNLSFLIDVQSSDANTELHLTRCLATSTDNVSDPINYIFIENGCETDPGNFIFGYDCNKTDNSQTFVLSVFRFAGQPAGSSIFFHCDAIVCLTNPPGVCTSQCAACSSRKRRALEDDSMEDLAEAHLVLGPYKIVDLDEDNDEQDDIDDGQEKEDQTEAIKDSENFPVTIVVVVCVSAFVAMAIIAALLVTIRLSKNARGPAVKEVTAGLARDNLGFDELDITTLSMKPNDKAI